MHALNSRRPSAPLLISFIALFAALSGSALALSKGEVRSKHIAKNAVAAKHVKGKAIKTPKLADGAVTSAKVAAGSLTGADIAANSLTGEEIDRESLGIYAPPPVELNRPASDGESVQQVVFTSAPFSIVAICENNAGTSRATLRIAVQEPNAFFQKDHQAGTSTLGAFLDPALPQVGDLITVNSNNNSEMVRFHAFTEDGEALSGSAWTGNGHFGSPPRCRFVVSATAEG